MNQTTLVVLDEAGLEAIVQRVLNASKPVTPEPQPKTGKALLTVEEACAMLSVTRVTLHTWKKSGRLPYHRIGHRVYFKEEEIMGAMKMFGVYCGDGLKRVF